MSHPVPKNLPELMDLHAELAALRFAAGHTMDQHDRMARRAAEEFPYLNQSHKCNCPACRQVRPFLEREAHGG